MAGARSQANGAGSASFDERADRLGLTWAQGLIFGGLAALWTWGLSVSVAVALTGTTLAFHLAFLLCAGWRLVLVTVSRAPAPCPPDPAIWPRYTLLVALHDEAEIMDQLVERLNGIDYPPDRIEGYLLLEAHDVATIAAARQADRPPWLDIRIVPPGRPQTKPRALNHGLAQATGDLLVVYDAEDDPDPRQLREAAARFAAAPPNLACFQAPLRIRVPNLSGARAGFLDRQFAAEYAALFDVILPGMARLDLPFPLGGTSNHFQVEALRAVGGWDAHNVTEDADLAFRLWRNGWRQGMLTRPTHEPPPGDMDQWLPQRTRWIKGFMQTWGVHTRHLGGLGWRGGLSLTMTLGAGILAAAIHAASLAWIVAAVLVGVVAGISPATPIFAIGVLAIGTVSAWLTCSVGARRAGISYSVGDMAAAPLYWSMLTLAFGHACWRLVCEPHAWDKTAHRPDVATPPITATDPFLSLANHQPLPRDRAKLRR